MKLAVMQGRLSAPEDGRIQCFPRRTWRGEFALCADIGIPAIEWIDDRYGAQLNPLLTEDGIREMEALMEAHGIAIPSICADSLMEKPLIRCTESECAERIHHLQLLLTQGKRIGATHVGIPFLDHAAITTTEEMELAAHALAQILPDLDRMAMELHLETSLDPAAFHTFLHLIDHPRVRVTYDTGNSTSLGFDPAEEFAAYGDRIGSVHIKDRKRGGTTVPLGTGDTDFDSVAAELRKIRFTGLFTLQAARGKTGKEVELLKKYREFVEQTFGAK